MSSVSLSTSARDLKGVVVSDKMNKTIVVQVERVTRHAMYNKVLRVRKSYKVHDEKEVAKVGDVVIVRECAPFSKTKHMVLVKVANS